MKDEQLQNSELQAILEHLQKREKYLIHSMRLHHKITFAFLVFFGINLLWYGMWGLVAIIPFLNNPIISLLLGSIILIATGFFYENLVSSNFNRKRKISDNDAL